MSDGENDRSLAGWWTRVRRPLVFGSQPPDAGGDPSAEDVVYPSKVLRHFLDGMQAITAPVLVDLGPVIGSNISFLGELLSCKIHVEDLYADIDRMSRAGQEDGLAAFLSTRLPYAPGSVDGVLAWDLFDYLDVVEADAVARQIVKLLKPGGFVMALFSTVLIGDRHFRKYVIVDSDHLRHRLVPSARSGKRVLLGRDVERLFAPVEVAESYLLKHHQSETLLQHRLAGRKRR